MKTMQRVMMLALVVVMLASIMVLPASAATYWQSEFANFKPVSAYYASIYPGYLWAMQSFLFAHPETQDEMSGSTHDGVWGSKTRAAIIDFQRYKGLTQDAIAGTATWNAVAAELSSETTSWAGVSFYRLNTSNGNHVYMASTGSSPSFYYFVNGSVHESNKFHSA